MTDRYTLISELGRGGMGVVWKARDGESSSIVALKLLHPAFSIDPDYTARFDRELRLAARIHSANVVRVLDSGVREGAPFIVMEYIEGSSLRELLVSHGPYGWAEARPLLAAATQGLADAHAAGVIHRDLKPSNILVGNDGIVRIADFGIAKGVDLTRVTGTSTLLGTPAYLAPEGPLDERSDLYSLGIIGYELLTGAAPFKGTTYQEVIVRHIREAPDLTKLPEEARPIIGWLLAKDPAERPQRAAALLPVLWGGLPVPGAAAAPATAPGPVAPEAPTVVAGDPGPVTVAETVVIRTPSPRASTRRGATTARMPTPRTPGGVARGLGGPVMEVARVWHTATLLEDGSVLIAGGRAVGDLPLAQVEIFDPEAGSLTVVGRMKRARADHAALRTRKGSVVFIGGMGRAAMSSVERFDPNTGRFDFAGQMLSPRSEPTANLVPDDGILIVGGHTGNEGDVLATTEIFLQETSSSVPGPSLADGRCAHTATLLPRGRVLIAGGYGPEGRLDSVEVIDYRSGRCSTASPMLQQRDGHTATRLAVGVVLLAGGSDAEPSAELWDEATARFITAGSMRIRRDGHTATALPDGRVLILGGATRRGATSSAEMFDPGTREFEPVGRMQVARVDHSATLLQDGRVFVCGGLNEDDGPLASTEIFEI